jgi:exonuclease SbcC
MIIETIRVKNFLSHGETEVDFRDAPMWLVCGENGAGKSALFDAVEYALYGAHRGGDQDAKALVKQGAEDALVQVVARLDDGGRYRVTRHLSARDGNRGGSVEELDDDDTVIDVPNVGPGVRSAWTWLERRLPPHDLFRSAILLRQNETAHFLKRFSARERMKLFAALIGLDRYTRVAERAASHKVDADQRRLEAQARIDALKDVSDEALARAQAELAEAEAAFVTSQSRHGEARAVREGATEWNRLLAEQAQREAERTHIQQLLAQAETIRRDHERVSAWDHASAQLGAYWRARDDARKLRDTVERARAEGAEAEEGRRRRQGERVAAEAAHTALTERDLPGARARRAEAEACAADLTREAEIAAAGTARDEARADVERLADADEELARWQRRREALVYLKQFADARKAAGEAERDLQTARAEREEADAGATAATEALERATTARDDARSVAEERSARAQALEGECKLLEGRIQSHSGLTGKEDRCPVCVRPLDAGAHAHVRAVLAEEQAALADRRAERDQAQRQVVDARAALKDAEAAHKRAGDSAQQAVQRAALAAQRLTTTERAHADARARLRETRAALTDEHPDAVEDQKLVTPAWVSEEELRVRRGIGAVEPRAAALAAARQRLVAAESALSTRRDQRRAGVEPLGDTLAAADLHARADAATAEAKRLADGAADLEAQAKKLERQIRELTGEEQTFAERARACNRQAEEAGARSQEESAAAEKLAAALGDRWVTVLTDRAAYDAERQAVEERRASAAKAGELMEAQGRLKQVAAALAANAEARAAVPPAHRLPTAEAERQEGEASQAVHAAGARRTLLAEALADLERRRADVQTERQTLNAAAEEAQTFGLLAEMLKEGGPVQNLVAEQEQRAIAEEVNAVLERLNDGLQVVIGGARRSRTAGLQDIKVRDTADPHGEARHFEFLSGGEQFRVAVALALALHRRVGRRVGTLVIDEGFGALDSNRRDALAQEMANQADGILALGYAQNIIICSHSTEVQRHFPYRWEIRKRNGVAGACRPDLDGIGVTASLVGVS